MFTTHFREINQSLEEQDCHFLDECWEISSAINLSRFRHPGFYQMSSLQLCVIKSAAVRGDEGKF